MYLQAMAKKKARVALNEGEHGKAQEATTLDERPKASGPAHGFGACASSAGDSGPSDDAHLVRKHAMEERKRGG